jgi:hypothetical protein
MTTITRNRFHASVASIAADEGYDSVMELVEDFALESVVPACCTEGCQVEPDGSCEHGNQSILLELGYV